MDVKEAIETYKNIKKYKSLYAIIDTNFFLNFGNVVLSELEKKDEEIIRLSKTANEYKKAIQCEKCNCSVCEAHINTLELRAELEKKDKIIDEMAEYISKRKCLEGVQPTEDYCNGRSCVKCTMDYFTKKCEGK